jgi:predicted ABC-type transport system involved in lysophospholipase L1 biosynthesis ATPase subunit
MHSRIHSNKSKQETETEAKKLLALGLSHRLNHKQCELSEGTTTRSSGTGINKQTRNYICR